MNVCIGLTTRNRFEVLEKAIRSALAQDYPHKEVVVVDDGSTDQTQSLRSAFPTVRWYRNEQSQGLLAARNQMMERTAADFFISLDDDAWFLNGDEVRVAVQHIQRHPEVASVAFDILQQGTHRFQPVPRQAAVESNVFIGCGHLLRLAAVAKVGYYEPFPVKYGHEEKDLSIRLIDAGYHIHLLPGVHVRHEPSPLARDLADQQLSYIINDLIFPLRRAPLLFLPAIVLANLKRKVQSREYPKKIVYEALRQVWKFAPAQMRAARRVRMRSYVRYRKLSVSYLEYVHRHSQKVMQA